MQTMTYARMKAARPAKAAIKREPWTVDADEVWNWVGVEVAAGAVTLCAYEIEPVDEGAALTVGATVTVE